MNDSATDRTPDADPALALRARLLDLSAFLRTTRAGFDAHRQALRSFEQFDNRSASAGLLVQLLEIVERGVDQLSRETARAGSALADQAFQDALRSAPELGAGGAKP